MDDKMFAYMSRVVALCNDLHRFPIQPVSSDLDMACLNEAIKSKWISVKGCDYHVTKLGWHTYMSEKNDRNKRADKCRAVSRKKPLLILAKIAKWIVLAAGAAVIAELVALLFH